jgi:selenocysteine lyase/cysteine desulfurase
MGSSQPQKEAFFGFPGVLGPWGTEDSWRREPCMYSADLSDSHPAGLAAAEAYNMGLRRRCWDLLQGLPGLEILSPVDDAEGLASPLLTLRLPPSTTPAAAHDALLAKGFTVKLLPDHEGGTPFVANSIRVAFHVFVMPEEVDRFVIALKDFLSSHRLVVHVEATVVTASV